MADSICAKVAVLKEMNSQTMAMSKHCYGSKTLQLQLQVVCFLFLDTLGLADVFLHTSKKVIIWCALIAHFLHYSITIKYLNVTIF